MASQPRIAVLLPCYNDSSDRTIERARAAGAVVRLEKQQGKGNVVRRMFADVDADVYLMADGDLTYDPAAAAPMVAMLLADQLDMVVGTRKHEAAEAYRGGHVLGNRIFTGLLAGLFGRSFTDIFSGYRAFSRRFVKSFPVLSAGFEIETEMSVHALELRMPVGELETAYAARPEGSTSKLSTYRDGWRILKTIVTLYRIERPVLFFGSIGLGLLILGIILAIPLISTYLATGLVPRLPTAILITGLGIVATLCLFAGLILDTVTRGRREVRRLAYLAHRAPGND
jgi:glycosyltransferase involved in cell wall biosynthesis